MFYAQIDVKGVCTGIAELSGKVEVPELIELDSYDLSLLGKKYAAGEWIELPPKPEPVPEPTQTDRIEEQNLNIMTAMAEMYEEAQANRLDDMEVQATIYEAILMNGGM